MPCLKIINNDASRALIQKYKIPEYKNIREVRNCNIKQRVSVTLNTVTVHHVTVTETFRRDTKCKVY